MSHVEYRGYKIDRASYQWRVWDEGMQDWIYLSCDNTFEDLKRYLDDLDETRKDLPSYKSHIKKEGK